MIEPLRPDQTAELEELLPRLSNTPLAPLAYVTPTQTRAYWLDEIRRDLTDPSASAWVVRAGGGVGGLILYVDAPWDSKVVGEPVGILRHFAAASGNGERDQLLETAVEHTIQRGVRCLTCKVAATDNDAIHSLEKQGFLLMDSVLDFVFSSDAAKGNKTKSSEGDPIIRPATAEDLGGAIVVAKKAFAHYFGRYHADPNVSSAVATNIYREWVQSSFHGWADWILVAEIDRQIVGFGIWKKASELEARHSLDVAHYNLAGIHPDFSGRGLYSALAADGMHRAQEFAKHLIGPVHISNYAVHRALTRLGWKSRAARHSFHKWL